MKSTFLLLLVSLLSSFHASAQTHFITAGQTQGMIVTDYVPDTYMFQTGGQRDFLIDLNYDGYNDLTFRSWSSGATNGTAYGVALFTADSSIQIISTPYSSGSYCSSNIPKAFNFNDTISNNYPLSYSNYTAITYYSAFHGSFCGYGIGPIQSGCYFSGRLISATDTSLFYIHIIMYSSAYYCMDYAIEGQDSTIVISSTNDLTASNISISPNPFTNQINISIDKPFAYQITDYVGRVILKGKTERSIETGELAAGNYLLLIKNEETYSVKKIVKAKN